MPKIKISLSSLILIPAVLFDPSGEITATVISAALHEIGHISVIFFLGIGMTEIRITPYGLEISTARRYRSFSEEIAVSCAGCFVNIFCFLTLFRLEGLSRSIAFASLLLGIINALPILSLDGGEALSAALNALLPFRTAERISRGISFITLVMLWMLAAYIFLFSGYNYSLFIMSVWLFGKIYCGRS